MSEPATLRERVVEFLLACGADDIVLHHRTLMTHLEGTEAILRRWGAPESLAIAGLIHAAYGTDGLAQPLIPPGDRQELRDLIGDEAEEGVYVYGCCDRRVVYPKLSEATSVQWRDRFTGDEWAVGGSDLRQFMELTWANALDAAAGETAADWDSVGILFAMTSHLVSPAAVADAADLGLITREESDPSTPPSL